MNKLNKKIILRVVAIFAILLGIILLGILMKETKIMEFARNRIENILKAQDEEQMETVVEYTISDVSEDELALLILVKNPKGIEKITCGDMVIQCNGKEKVALDRIVQNGTAYTIQVKAVDEEKEEKYTLIGAKDTLIHIANWDTLGDGTTKTIRIPEAENLIEYYSLDDGKTWQEYTGEFNVLEKNNYTIAAKYEVSEGKLLDINENNYLSVIVSDSIVSAARDASFKNDSYYRMIVKDKEYGVHTYLEEGDMIYESDKTYGDQNDVATVNTDAKNMVIARINGNLTINEGVTVGPYYSNYGGPKGFLLCCTETLTNNGTIQNNYGAKSTGEDVYLWKNANGTYEYVPEAGGSGGVAVAANDKSRANGNKGTDASNSSVISGSGVKRATAGGGSGGVAVQNAYYTQYGSRGGNGTSYGAGGGGGGTARHSNNYSATPYNGIGIAGGAGGLVDGSYYVYLSAAGGGAGLPPGNGVTHGSGRFENGEVGTGGLLMIYSRNIVMKEGSQILANGKKGGNAYGAGGSGITGSAAAGGAGSGGGSVNVFAETINVDGEDIATYIDVSGGAGGTASGGTRNAVGGAGGTGSCNIGYINSGTYESYYSNN